MLVATGKATVGNVASGTTTLTVKLRASGKRILKRAKHSLKLTSKVAFTPVSQTDKSQTKLHRFTLRQ